MSQADLRIRVEGRAGRITLDRPAALNALTLPMVRGLAAALTAWRAAAEVEIVLIDAAGPRAFCAGGDVAQIYAQSMAGNPDFAGRFWREEYALNHAIARYAKPVVALVHGFCLGGGVGIACHARHRIVGQSARLAMPECGIGLVPDAGGSALLARAPKGIGTYLALTGAMMDPAAAIEAGFADLFVAEEVWPEAIARLQASADPAVLTALATPAPASRTGLPDAALRQAFARDSLAAIHEALCDLAGDAAILARAALDKASPLALATTFEIQRRLRDRADLREALRLEYRAAQRCLRSGDLLEGVRARLIERDQAPHWRHAGLSDVSQQETEAMLSPIEGEDFLLAD